MIITQEQAVLKSLQQLQSIQKYIQQAVSDGQRIDLVVLRAELWSHL